MDVGSIPARASIVADPAPGTTARRGRRHGLLRHATGALHDAIEAAAAGQGFFATLEGYRRFIQRSARFHGALEAQADAAGAAGLLADWPERRKLPLLAADCAALA